MTSWLWNLLNVGISLVGYYMAAFMIDWKWYGRKRMQVYCFPHLCAFVIKMTKQVKSASSLFMYVLPYMHTCMLQEVWS